MQQCETGSSKCWFSWISSLIQSPLLLVIRVIWGILFVNAGLGKLMNMGQTIDFFTMTGIPLPVLTAWLVALIETVGGALFLFGLYARAAGLLLAIVMVGALLTAHKAATFNLVNDFGTFMQQAPFTFLFASLTVVAFGSGFFSLDKILCCCKKRDKCCK